MLTFSTLPPLSLYIHIPWCIRKCPYCDFNSHEIKENVPEESYINTLLQDLECDLPRVWGRRIQSIFLGGGTPSVLSPESINELLAGIRARIPVNPQAEITLEANPGTVDYARFQGYYQAGVNRLSLGVQSFDAQQLKNLGRIHSPQHALDALSAIKAAGFTNFNVDLMFGLPQQGIEEALNDLHQLVELAPPHLSWYQLTIEPNTYFYQHPPNVPEDDFLWEMQQAGQNFLADKGYHQYEVSAYTSKQQYCKHNINYWQFGDYLGIGAGAHGKISDAQQGTITRLSKHRHPRQYLTGITDKQFIHTENVLNKHDIYLEFMMNSLRLTQGFDYTLFEQHTGLPIAPIMPILLHASDKGWLLIDNQHIRPTDTGLCFLNELLELFLQN